MIGHVKLYSRTFERSSNMQDLQVERLKDSGVGVTIITGPISDKQQQQQSVRIEQRLKPGGDVRQR